MKMDRMLSWTRSLVFLFLAGAALGQSAETVNGVRYVHNGEEGQWGKKPRVQVELVRTLGDVAAEDETVAFYMPAGIALDSQGNLYILDTGNHRVQKFGPDGRYLASLGRQGQGPGDFSYPDSIDIDGEDMVWVSDPNNQRIQVLTPEGAERKTIGFVKERVGKVRRTPSGLVMAGGGGVFFAGPGLEEKEQPLPKLFKKLDLDGKVTGEYGEPFNFEHPLLNQMGNQVTFAVDEGGCVYLAYLYQNRLEKYSPEGKLLWRADRKLDYSTDPPKDKGKREASGGGLTIRMPRMNQCAEGIAVDGQGRIWVVTLNRQTREEEQVGVNMSVNMSGGERKMSMKADGNTDLRTTDMYKLEVFSPEGELLGSLPLDHFIDGITIKGDRLFLWDAMRGAKFFEYRIKER
jgi:sugar lactone lactonase YvrE